MSNLNEQLLIFTAHPEFSDAALKELKTIDAQLLFMQDLAPGIVLCKTSNISGLIASLQEKKAIFVRHLASVQTIQELHNNADDITTIVAAIAQLPGLSMLGPGIHFAVQTRITGTDKNKGPRPFSSGQLNKMIAEALSEETGALEDIKKPEVIISILCTMDKSYIGISPAIDNLSSWPGGARHFAQTDDQVSRAEFKLLEALEVFGITLPSSGTVLDLGAAPGGWSRILLQNGLRVVAVDPAKLDPALSKAKGLEYYQGYAEQYIEDSLRKHRQFDLIVNDMRMDARDAARLLAQASLCLKNEGIIISVLKLPHETTSSHPLIILKEALTILRGTYQTVQARQLFHNRQEVTVLAAHPVRKKPSRS